MRKDLHISRIDRERRETERRGAQRAGALAVRLQAMAMRELKTGKVQDYKRAVIETMLPEIRQTLTAAFLQGARRSQLMLRGKATPQEPIEFAAPLSPNAKTVRYLQMLLGADAQTLLEVFEPAALNALTSAGAAINDRIRGVIAELVLEGAHVSAGVAALQSAFRDMGIAAIAGNKLEAIYRTQSAIAYGAGRWAADQDPAVQEILWGYEYSTVGDDRVRPEHAALNGIRRPKDDPFWQINWPPNGWNCRCIAIPITVDEPEAKAKGDDRGVVIDPSFRFNPGVQRNLSLGYS